MTERIPQSTTKLVVFKAYLSSDHVTEATGKTIAITISKNGGAFGNPNAGATNATEISSGWYKVTLDTTDTNTLGPIAVRGAVATIDDVGVLLEIVSATTGGYTNLDAAITSRMATYTQPTGFLAATFPGTVASTTNITAGTITTTTNLTNAPTSGDFTATMKTSLNAATPAVTVSDKTGFALTAAYDAAKTAATQTSVDDLPTNAELSTALGTADDAVLTAIGDLPTNAELATALGSADDAVLAAIADLPTNAELATALSTADDAVLSAIAALDIPTAIENADALLDRDMSTGADSGSTTVRTPRQALRFLRNKWSIAGSTLTVTKENDSTASWTAAVTGTSGADPITASDPAGP
jgi:hypothetical protein